jgi:DNA-binding CsgD family transcriptional regulator
MGILLFITIGTNLLLFSGLGLWAWRFRQKEESPRIRLLATAVVVVSAAFVLSAVTRLVSVAVRLEWLDGRVADFIVSEWHLVQSLAATAVGVIAIVVVRRHAVALKAADWIATAVSARLLEGGSLHDLGFTNREIEVLQAISKGQVSDSEIAETLYIAPATAATHVKNILRKTGVRSRRELALLVASAEL